MADIPFLASSASEILFRRPAILGCPLDMTSTYRSGSGAAPPAIRAVSDSIETYSPLLDMDLLDSPFADLGDLDLATCSLDQALDRIQHTVSALLAKGARPLCLGGEHLVTLPIIKALKPICPDAVVIHLDAHSDLRDRYNGMKLNHATVIRRVYEVLGADKLIQLGIRGGTREEFSWMRQNGTLMEWGPFSDKTLLKRVDARPVYLTLDIDVLDPACVAATGNPESGGWTYRDLENFFLVVERMELVGADVVELNPGLDVAQVGAITAAKIVRELLLLLGRER
jgi:agmatinase